MPHKRLVAFILVGAAALAFAACGGGSPTSPSTQGVVVRGTVVGAPTAGVSSLSTRQTAAALTVFVQENPAITATVAADRTFTLRGLPQGGFTLVFTSGGTTLGSLGFAEVQPNQEITITVRVDGSAITLVDQQRNGIGHGDARSCMIEGGRVGQGIELEGSVASGGSAGFMMRVQGNRSSGNVQIDSSGASFKCNGPKTTPAECLASVKSGAKVHVSGTLVSCDVASAVAQAHQVMVQK